MSTGLKVSSLTWKYVFYRPEHHNTNAMISGDPRIEFGMFLNVKMKYTWNVKMKYTWNVKMK